jgi:hypothetical protein
VVCRRREDHRRLGQGQAEQCLVPADEGAGQWADGDRRQGHLGGVHRAEEGGLQDLGPKRFLFTSTNQDGGTLTDQALCTARGKPATIGWIKVS